MNNLNKVLIIFMFTFASCTAIIDNLVDQNFNGTFNLIEITDVKTNKKSVVNDLNTSIKILDGQAGNAITFAAPDFNVFYRFLGENGTTSGTYEADINVLTFKLKSGKTIKRDVISSNDLAFTLSDTINGSAKILSFEK